MNNPPSAVDDSYTVRDILYGGGDTPLTLNDSDPDGDPIRIVSVTSASHGSFRYFFQDDSFIYEPDPGFTGTDSVTYQVCDNLGLCAVGTVTLNVIGEPTPTPTPTPAPTPDPARNLGESCPNQMVGKPVNVTNANVYLKQTDYNLPGVGEAISFVRSYNSRGTRSGLFGPGWSTDYDEGLLINSENTTLQLYMPDGQATDFVSHGNGSFAPVQTDFFGAINQNANGSLSLSFKDGRVHVFDEVGRLLSLIDRKHNQTRLAYDESGRLASVTDPSGRVVSVTTNPFGLVLSLSDSLGAIATYTYNSSFKLISATYPDNSAFRFSYDANGLMTSVADALGNVLEAHQYDSQGRAVTSEKQGGVEHYSLNYVSGSETDVTDALGHITKYFFDTTMSRNVVNRIEGSCSCGSGSQSQTWIYDTNLNILSHSKSLNQTTTYTYDSQGNQLTMTDAAGTTTNTYNQFGQPLTMTDAMGGITEVTYDDQGAPLSIKDPLNHTTTFTSDSRGELLTMTDARGQTSSLVYDAAGNLIAQTDALGHATQFAYDGRGRLTSATNVLNFVTSYAYDSAGRVNKITRPDNTFLSFTYDLAGRRTKITDALSNSTGLSYDAAYRMTTLIDPLGNTTNYAFDLMSNLTEMTDALGRTTSYRYDDFNRLVKITYPPAAAGATPLQESFDYDAVGNITGRIDPAGRLSRFQYDRANRLVSVVDPASQITRYEYNSRSDLTAVVDALGQSYTFDYDALGRLITATRAGLQMSFAYDAVGNKTRRTDFNGMTTNYTYDALNRLTNITYPDSSTARYSFDHLSRLTAATNLNGTVSLAYDNRGRLTSTTDVLGQTINYTYDANGNRSKMSLGATTNATYLYDPLNRLTTITDGSGLSVDYAYDAMGRLISQTLPNDIVAAYSYDDLDRPTKLQYVKGKKVVVVNNYQYNDAGNVVRNVDQNGTHNYGYDSLDRLTSATYPATGNESYVYDAVGNRTSSQRSASYSYQPFNRLAGTSTANLLYDNNGNLISRNDLTGATQFAWDFENRLTRVVTPSSGSVSFKYDALGRRVQSAPASGVSANFVYDGQDVVKDLNSDGSTVEYLNGPGVDDKIRQTSTSGHQTNTLYYLTDSLGSTAALANTHGHVVEEIGYDSFGNSAGSANTRYGFTGRERDSLTGLLYYRARFYDPQLGRFISEDPVGLAGGINQFAYVGNNPQNAKDPSGLYEIDVHYYLTYFLARKTGCFSDAEAREIANGDQGVDENSETKPLYGGSERQKQVNAFYHGLHPGSHQPYLDTHWMIATTGGGGSLSGLGIYLHYLQDTFSHEGYTDPEWGHASGTHAMDKTDEDVSKAMRMAGATWDALNRFASEKKCGCHGKFDPSWWKQIKEFAEASGGGPYDRRRYSIEEIDPSYLRNKIRILGVSLR